MGADHDDAGYDCNRWVLWLENETALRAVVDERSERALRRPFLHVRGYFAHVEVSC
jgi:hypothetical protein